MADRRLRRQSPGFHDDLLLIDSTPVECARSVETTRRSALGDAADYGCCASHSRFFWGFRLHGLFAPDGTPGPSRSPLPSATSARSGSSCCERAEQGRRGDRHRRQGLRRAGVRRSGRRARAPRSSGRPARTSPTTAFTSPRSASGSSRSSGPARTSSPSSATAPAPSHNLRVRIAQRFLALAAASRSTTTRASEPRPGRLRRLRRGINHLGRRGARSPSSRIDIPRALLLG